MFVREMHSTHHRQCLYVREFQMMHAAEMLRFQHQVARAEPRRWNGHFAQESELSNEQRVADRFYARVIEHAIAYFGSRVLYPSRPAPVTDNGPLKRAAIDKIAQAAARGQESVEPTALELGQRIGSQIYDAYLAGKVAPGGLFVPGPFGRTRTGAQGLRCGAFQTEVGVSSDGSRGSCLNSSSWLRAVSNER
jgi:hypothetical protein